MCQAKTKHHVDVATYQNVATTEGPAPYLYV